MLQRAQIIILRGNAIGVWWEFAGLPSCSSGSLVVWCVGYSSDAVLGDLEKDTP